MLRIWSTDLYKPEVCVVCSSYGLPLWQFVPSSNIIQVDHEMSSQNVFKRGFWTKDVVSQIHVTCTSCYNDMFEILLKDIEGLFCFLYSYYFPVSQTWKMPKEHGLLMLPALGFSQAASTCGKIRRGVKLVERSIFKTVNTPSLVTC